MVYVLVVVVSALFFSPAVESAPAETSTYGTLVADDLSKDLAIINQNMHNGVTAVANPLLKLAIDTAPNLAHLYAIFNGINVSPSLAALAKTLYGNMAVNGGKLAGDAAVVGSSVLEASMKLGGHGLQAGNNVLDTAGKSGINLAGKLGDHAAAGTALGADIVASGLNSLGDGMLVGSTGANVVSQGISGVVDAIGERLVAAIATAERTASQLLDSRVKVLENGALHFANKTQERVYKGLLAYVQILTHVQNLINQLSSAMAGVASAASVASVSSGSSAT